MSMLRPPVILFGLFVALFSACDGATTDAPFAGPDASADTSAPPAGEAPPSSDPDPDPSTPPPGEDPGEQDPGEQDPPAPSDPPIPSNGECASFDLIWPTTGSTSEQTLVHDAYGPRLLDYSGYDWHRGIDLPGDASDEGFNSPVYAVADASIYAIGNRPNPSQGALSHYSKSAGNVIVLEHSAADLHPGAATLYSVYMHLASLPLTTFPARLGDDEAIVEVDLREYYYLDGAKTNANNRGRRRPTFKTGGEPIEVYPRVAQHDLIARVGDTGATYEHLHFELREGSPNSGDAINPFARLPHLDATLQAATLEPIPGGLRARIEIPREPGEIGATTDLSQQLDVDAVALQLRGPDQALIDELRFDFAELGLLDDADNPEVELDGATVTLTPYTFSSAEAVWRLDVEFVNLDAAELVPAPGEHYALVVQDACGNDFEIDM